MRELLVKAHVKVRISRTLRLLYKNLNEILRISYWQRPQQQTIHQRKNECSGCDSHGDQERSGSKEAGSAAQLANCVTEILHAY